VTPFPLRQTDVDLFRHVNNTVYWQGVHEVMALYPDVVADSHRAVVEYRKPIQPGESVDIHSSVDERAVRLWFVVADEVRAAGLLRSH
jgi:acyl-ACP thioesterase